MHGTIKSTERVEITLRDVAGGSTQNIFIDVIDSYLSRRWLESLIDVVHRDLHLEKNYCFLGFPNAERNGSYLCDQINRSISVINSSGLDYQIDDWFHLDDLLSPGNVGESLPGLRLNHDRFNRLHRYFEDLQGVVH